MKLNIHILKIADLRTYALKHLRTRKGFTLLEVVIAIFILALMSMMIWQITNNAHRGAEKAGLYDDVYQAARVALRKITDDVSMAFLVGPNMQGKLADGTVVFDTTFEGTGESLNFVSFSNMRYIKNEKRSDQIEVGYYLSDCPDTEVKKQCLLRRESFVVDKDSKEGGNSFPIAEAVKKVNFEYYDIGKQEWRGDWKSKDPSFLNRLPYAVRVTLVFEDPKDEREEITFETSATLALWAAPVDF